MLSIDNEIKKNIENKYRRRYFNTSLSKRYIKLIQNYYNKSKNYDELNFSLSNKIVQKDKLIKYLDNVYFNKIKFEEKKILKYYKTFEINLSIKNKNTKENLDLALLKCLYLSLLIDKLKSINNLQKLNVYLKIFDLILYKDKFFFHKHNSLTKEYFKNFWLILKKYVE